jgi:hypothetical protein
MGTAEAWIAGIVGALVLLVSIYLTLRFRALCNERVIGSAIERMRLAMAEEPAPQRVLLRSVADTLVAQERAGSRIEAALRQQAWRAGQAARAEDLLRELLDLPEPQQLVAEFLQEHGGSQGADAAFASLTADVVRAATAEVFGAPADESLVDLDRLLLLAEEGVIATVALAGQGAFATLSRPLPHVPQVTDRNPAALVALTTALDQMTRRHLRLATLVHGQGETILRLRRGEQPDLTGRWRRVRQSLLSPGVRPPGFGTDDLEEIATALDAIGEIVDTARERLAAGQPTRAVQLLAGLRVPAPAGLPGRLYHQESLAQVRPLAAFGVWHRLAVSRWAASALRAGAAAGREVPPASAVLAGSVDRSTPGNGGDRC